MGSEHVFLWVECWRISNTNLYIWLLREKVLFCAILKHIFAKIGRNYLVLRNLREKLGPDFF